MEGIELQNQEKTRTFRGKKTYKYDIIYLYYFLKFLQSVSLTYFQLSWLGL